MLSIVVGTDGRAGSITVTRSLGFGLDQKAIEAVQQWVFKPGEKNGVPVNTRAAVEVNFRLLAKPPAAPASAPPQ
jgi:protein TonB